VRHYLILTALCAASSALSGQDWQRVSEQDGIVVDRSRVAGSSVMRFRGQGLVAAPIDKLMVVLRDLESQRRWNPAGYANRFVEQVSATELVYYSAHRAPWPIQDRDYVIRIKLTHEPKLGRVTLDAAETEHPNAPRERGRTRMPAARFRWVLTRANEPGRTLTYVQVEFHLDPGGFIPGWMFNYVTDKYAYELIQNVRRENARGEFDAKLLKEFARYR